jgi:tRNA pseudouridine32 synthase / 23S rRNA pseudouridine746 synthase
MSASYAPPQDPWLVVLHQDRDLLAVDKPSGLLSVPGRQLGWQDSALARARRDHPRVYDVHRLDMDTSGLLVMALRRKAEAALKGQFEAHRVRKAYLARVAGQPPARGSVTLPLSRLGGLPPRNAVDHEHGKRAHTDFRVLTRGAEDCLLLLEPRTGRSHQLRVHMAAIGHPILGDRLYAPSAVRAAAERLLLHAWTLALAHPYSGQPMQLQAAPPQGLEPPERQQFRASAGRERR